MSIDADKLSKLQEKWDQIECADNSQPQTLRGWLDDIEKGLQGMGLDMSADETYDLLKPGVTEADFNQKKTDNAAIFVLSLYHSSQDVANQQYTDGYLRQRYWAMQGLMTYALQTYKSCRAKSQPPQSLTPIQNAQLDFIERAEKSGELEREYTAAAVDFVHHMYRNGLSFQKDVNTPDASENDIVYSLSQGKGAVKLAMEIVESHGADKFPKTDIYPECHLVKRTAETVEFSVEKLKALHAFFNAPPQGQKPTPKAPGR